MASDRVTWVPSPAGRDSLPCLMCGAAPSENEVVIRDGTRAWLVIHASCVEASLFDRTDFAGSIMKRFRASELGREEAERALCEEKARLDAYVAFLQAILGDVESYRKGIPDMWLGSLNEVP